MLDTTFMAAIGWVIFRQIKLYSVKNKKKVSPGRNFHRRNTAGITSCAGTHNYIMLWLSKSSVTDRIWTQINWWKTDFRQFSCTVNLVLHSWRKGSILRAWKRSRCSDIIIVIFLNVNASLSIRISFMLICSLSIFFLLKLDSSLSSSLPMYPDVFATN